MGTLSSPSTEKEISSALWEKSTPPHSKFPVKVAHSVSGIAHDSYPSCAGKWVKYGRQHTIVVADNAVEVELGIDLLAITVAETSPQDVAIIDADVLGAKVERHDDVVIECVCLFQSLCLSVLGAEVRKRWCPCWPNFLYLCLISTQVSYSKCDAGPLEASVSPTRRTHPLSEGSFP